MLKKQALSNSCWSILQTCDLCLKHILSSHCCVCHVSSVPGCAQYWLLIRVGPVTTPEVKSLENTKCLIELGRKHFQK